MVFVFLHHTSTPSRRCLNKAGIKLKVRLVSIYDYVLCRRGDRRYRLIWKICIGCLRSWNAFALCNYLLFI